MKRKITIDLVKDVSLDLTLEELDILNGIVKNSIRLAKKKKPKEESLFPDLEMNETKTTIFVNSRVNDIEVFKKELKNLDGLGIDIDFYYNSVKDWSEMNQGKKRNTRGWVATARTFMRSDKEKGKLKMISESVNENSDKEMLEYLKT